MLGTDSHSADRARQMLGQRWVALKYVASILRTVVLVRCVLFIQHFRRLLLRLCHVLLKVCLVNMHHVVVGMYDE